MSSSITSRFPLAMLMAILVTHARCEKFLRQLIGGDSSNGGDSNNVGGGELTRRRLNTPVPMPTGSYSASVVV